MKQKIHSAEWLYISLVILFSLYNHCPDVTRKYAVTFSSFIKWTLISSCDLGVKVGMIYTALLSPVFVPL